MSEPSDYENEQINRIIGWKGGAPGIVSQGLGYALQPISWLISTIIPHSAIESLLHASDWLAESTIRGDSMKSTDILCLEEIDSEADEVQNWAIGYASVEGGIAGAIGLFSLPADIPALITLSLRTIRRIGVCYGYDGHGAEEKQFVLGILASAGANSIQEKAASILTLQSLQTTLLNNTWKKMVETAAENAFGKEAALLFIRDLAKQLGINLTKRKALAAIPVIGAVVGGSLNGWYMRDVGIAAQRSYQERWLRDHGRWIDQEGQAKDLGSK